MAEYLLDELVCREVLAGILGMEDEYDSETLRDNKELKIALSKFGKRPHFNEISLKVFEAQPPSKSKVPNSPAFPGLLYDMKLAIKHGSHVVISDAALEKIEKYIGKKLLLSPSTPETDIAFLKRSLIENSDWRLYFSSTKKLDEPVPGIMVGTIRFREFGRVEIDSFDSRMDHEVTYQGRFSIHKWKQHVLVLRLRQKDTNDKDLVLQFNVGPGNPVWMAGLWQNVPDSIIGGIAVAKRSDTPLDFKWKFYPAKDQSNEIDSELWTLFKKRYETFMEVEVGITSGKKLEEWLKRRPPNSL